MEAAPVGTEGMTLLAPAKLNLHLGVHPELDERGYHRVDSIMIAIDLTDEVTVVPSDGLRVACVPAVDFPQEKNTAFVAARRMGELAGREPNVSITLKKRIPEQSGMGGSSSDAAGVIRALCLLWGLDPRSRDVLAVARSVGADVPFFLNPVPTFLVGGGDEPKESFPPMDGLHIALVRPEGPGVSTVEAYRAFDRSHEDAADSEPMCSALRGGDAGKVSSLISNNLDPIARALRPEDSVVKEWLAAQVGVLSCMVTGSGSCVFAICESEERARAIVEAAQAHGGWWSEYARTASDFESANARISRGFANVT